MTTDDLWPPPNYIGFFYKIWATLHGKYCDSQWYSSSDTLVTSFQSLTSDDRRWPLTSTKINKALLLIKAIHIPHITTFTLTILEIHWLQGFQSLTSVDLKWPLTSTKINRDLLLDKSYPHAKYHYCRFYSSEDMLVTMFTKFDLWWPQMTIDLHQNQ